MSIQLVDKDALAHFSWPRNTLYHQAWLEPFMYGPTNKFIRNVETEVKVLKMNDTVLPMTINHEEFQNSYVCSPYNAYISYASDELKKLNYPILIYPLKGLLFTLAGIFRLGKINYNIHCNNWLLSTNLYDDIPLALLTEMTKHLIAAYREHYIVFRSLNNYINAKLITELQNQHYRLIPSRQVYIFDRMKCDFMKFKNVKADLKLLAKSNYKIAPHDQITEIDYEQIVELYNALYLEKYSYHNPQFTEHFIKNCHQNRLFTIYGLRDANGKLQGVIGYFERNGIITTPLVGYNTEIPQSHGLYRMLIAISLRDAADKNLILNLSAGAGHFKRTRGGFPVIEYSAIYMAHLPFFRRIPIHMIRVIAEKIGVRLMKKFKL